MAKHRKPQTKKYVILFLLVCSLVGSGWFLWKDDSPTLKEVVAREDTTQPKTVTLHNGPSLADPQDLATPQLDPTIGATLHQKLLAAHFIGTALIFRNGRILVNQGYGFADFADQRLNTVNSHFQIGSIQKSFTAVLIAKLIAAGKLTYMTPLSQFYPAIPNSHEITINDLIHMSSGLNTTGSPKGVTDPQQIEAYYLQHLTSNGPGKFFYTPINYFLLARIIEKITGSSYQSYFRNVFGAAGLKHLGFYQDWYQQPDHTVSYQVTATPDDYSQPIHEGLDEFAREHGTGNVDMTSGDLYWYFHQLYQGQILKKDQLAQLWAKYPGTNYIGGLYNLGSYYRMHGNESGQRVMMLATKDFQTGVLLLSNRENGKVYTDVMNDLFQSVSSLNVTF